MNSLDTKEDNFEQIEKEFNGDSEVNEDTEGTEVNEDNLENKHSEFVYVYFSDYYSSRCKIFKTFKCAFIEYINKNKTDDSKIIYVLDRDYFSYNLIALKLSKSTDK